MENFNPKTQIAIIWSIEDVQEVRPDLSDDDAMVILLSVKRYHDANFGITWETIAAAADSLYPEAKSGLK